MTNKIFKTFAILASLLATSSCIHVEIKGAGVFKEPLKHEGKWYVASVDVPPGLYGKYADSVRKNGEDGSKVAFRHIGECGAQLSFTGVMIPIIPFWLPNFCESKGLDVGSAAGAEISGVTLQLYYSDKTRDPYIENGSIKFKIGNFSEFKKAPDKSLILHKRNPDGTIFTKELPFDWKIVTEVSGGL